MATESVPVSPEEYASLFENNPEGQRIFEDMTKRFVRPHMVKGGIDGIRESDVRAGQRSVIEFIVRRINQAAGVEAADNEQESEHG